MGKWNGSTGLSSTHCQHLIMMTRTGHGMNTLLIYKLVLTQPNTKLPKNRPQSYCSDLILQAGQREVLHSMISDTLNRASIENLQDLRDKASNKLKLVTNEIILMYTIIFNG